MQFPVRFFILFLIAGLIATAAFRFGATRSADAAGAALNLPNVLCDGALADANFSWTAIGGAQEQWLDLTVDDTGFAPGTVFAFGPFDGGQSSAFWEDLEVGRPHFWRINTLTPAGWVTSETSSFVPCGYASVIAGWHNCVDTETANLEFRWSPRTPARVQYLDVGFDPNFTPETYGGVGPLDPGIGYYAWNNMAANGRYYFRVNTMGADGAWYTSSAGSFLPLCGRPRAAVINNSIYGSSDRLISPRLGINAPVNMRDVGYDGVMGDPAGPTDVIRYNFDALGGLGGHPGVFGTTVMSGHVDYRNYGLAVFAPLRNVQKDDILEYHRSDGVVILYAVDWWADIYPGEDWNQMVASSNPESIVLITCNGEFNYNTREYSHRRAVHGVRIN